MLNLNMVHKFDDAAVVFVNGDRFTVDQECELQVLICSLCPAVENVYVAQFDLQDMGELVDFMQEDGYSFEDEAENTVGKNTLGIRSFLVGNNINGSGEFAFAHMNKEEMQEQMQALAQREMQKAMEAAE